MNLLPVLLFIVAATFFILTHIAMIVSKKPSKKKNICITDYIFDNSIRIMFKWWMDSAEYTRKISLSLLRLSLELKPDDYTMLQLP